MKKVFLAIICIAIVFQAGPARSFRDVRKVRRIEFRGLRYLSKYEIISNVEMRVVRDGVIVNIGSMNTSLRNMAMVQSYRVVEENGNLVVAVVEREPCYLFAVLRNGKVVPFEVDENFRVLSVGRIHAEDRPLIIISDGDLRGGRFSRRIRKFSEYMSYLENRHSAFFRELSEISIADPANISFTLRNRRTRFYVAQGMSNMDSVKHMVAYFDAVRYYPVAARIFGNIAVTK